MEVPVRKTLLDVVKHTLATINRNAFIHRYVYVGEYSYNDKHIIDLMSSSIDAVNNGYCEEPLTGLLLVLPKYFVHFLDGSEDSIIKHFTILQQKNSEYLVRCRLLVAFHHVNRRMFDNWTFKKEQPPAMIEKINPSWDYAKNKQYVEQCVKKIYRFMVTLHKIDKGKILNDEQKHLKSDVPTVNLLEFLLNSQYLHALEEIFKIFDSRTIIRTYSEMIWPIRSDNVYYEVFTRDDERFKEEVKFSHLVKADWLGDYSKR